MMQAHEAARRADIIRDQCRRRADVAELRERVAAAGIQLRGKSDPVMLARVLDRVGDIEVAADAILMEPRPIWLRTLIGYDLMRTHATRRR